MADSAGYPGTPRRVKVFGIIALILALAFGLLHLAGRGLGDHSPSRNHEAPEGGH